MKDGWSFTGVMVTFTSRLSVTEPSLTVTVKVSLPVALVFGVYVTDVGEAPVVGADTDPVALAVPFVAPLADQLSVPVAPVAAAKSAALSAVSPASSRTVSYTHLTLPTTPYV